MKGGGGVCEADAANGFDIIPDSRCNLFSMIKNTTNYFTTETIGRTNAFPLRVAEPWKNLSESVVQATSINSFKYRLDKTIS